MPKEKQSLTSAQTHFLLENQRNVYSFTICYRAPRVDFSRYTTSYIAYVWMCTLAPQTQRAGKYVKIFPPKLVCFIAKVFGTRINHFFFASYRPGRWSSRRMLCAWFCGSMPPYQHQMDDAGSKVVVWMYNEQI